MKRTIWVLAGLMAGTAAWAQNTAIQTPGGTSGMNAVMGAPLAPPQGLVDQGGDQIDPFNNQPAKVDALISDYQKLKIEEKISSMQLKKKKDEAEMELLPLKVMKAKESLMPPPPPPPPTKETAAASHVTIHPPAPTLTVSGIMNSGKERSAIVQWQGQGHVVRAGSHLPGGLDVLAVGPSAVRYRLHYLVHEVAFKASAGRFTTPATTGDESVPTSGGEASPQAIQSAIIRQQSQAGAPNGIQGLPPMQPNIPTIPYQ